MELQIMMESTSENGWVNSSTCNNVVHQQLLPGRSSDYNNTALEQQQVSFCIIMPCYYCDCYCRQMEQTLIDELMCMVAMIRKRLFKSKKKYNANVFEPSDLFESISSL